VTARLAREVKHKHSVRVRACDVEQEGEDLVVTPRRAGSGILRSMAMAEGLMVARKSKGVAAGDW